MKINNETNFFTNKYFTESELKCKGSGELKLAPGFLGSLVFLREIFGKPMIVTSCCRSPEHNKKVGGSENSFHLTEGNVWGTEGTLAVDILTRTEDYRQELIRVSREMGWSVGFGDGFIHLDMRIFIGLPRAEFDY